RVAADNGGAAGERADALRDAERVAADHADLVRRDAELVGGDLGQRGLEPLPLRRHAGEDGEAARRIGADRRALERAHAGQLEVAGEADAEEAALLAGAQAFLREPIPPGHLQRAAQHRRVVAAVVDDVAEAAVVGQADVVWHVGGLYEVREADGGAIAAGLAGDQVHDALEHEDGLRLAGAAVGRDGHSMGIDAGEAHLDVGDAVGPGQRRGGEQRHHEPARRVGPVSCTNWSRRASRRPSSSKPTSTVWVCVRSCVAVSMCSRRSSSQRTGRPKRIASSGMSTSSGYTMSLAPKPPPTSGAITRTRWGGRSSSSQMNWRTWCGACVDAHTVSSPAMALYSATSPRVSMGWPPARPIDRLKR